MNRKRSHREQDLIGMNPDASKGGLPGWGGTPAVEAPSALGQRAREPGGGRTSPMQSSPGAPRSPASGRWRREEEEEQAAAAEKWLG